MSDFNDDDLTDENLTDGNQTRENTPDLELLTSYLDGELDDAEIQAVENRIASDADFRLQMQSLQRTWDLLDTLPVESAGSSFTRTTIEMVADDAIQKVKLASGNTWKRPLTILGLVVLPIGIFAGSFLTARQVQQDNLEQLVEVDLPAIERFDHYLAIDQDLDFLISLHDSGLFSDETALYSAERDELAPELLPETTPALRARSAPSDPFARLEAMDADQLDSLRRKREKFEKMTRQEQDSLQQFHQTFSSHDKAKELRETLNDYFDWLGTLPSLERAELTDMPTGDRLSEIARTLIRRAGQEFGRSGITQLPPEDARAVFDWHEAVLKQNAKKIRQLFAQLVQRRNSEKRRRLMRGRLAELTKRPLNQLVGVLIRADLDRDVRTYRDSVKEMLFSSIDQLRPKLSEEALAILDSKTTNGKQELLLKWTEAANQTRSKVTIVQLQKFFEQLSTEQRDKLDQMSFENWEQTLTRLYRQNQLSRSTGTSDLSDEQSVQSLAEESGLEVPDQTESDFWITIEDMGIPLDLGTGLNLDNLNLPFEDEPPTPDNLINDAPVDEK